MTDKSLRLRLGDRSLELKPGSSLTIGRGASADLGTDNPYVSRVHAVVRHEDDGWVLEDAGSSRGMFVNGARVQRLVVNQSVTVTLAPPDVGAKLVLELAAAETTPVQAPEPADPGRERTMRRDLGIVLRVAAGTDVGHTFIVDRTETIGRDPEAGIALEHDSVSWHHARITVEAGGVRASDLGSTNGTFVNGVRISGERPLTVGDEVRVGSIPLEVTAGGTAALPPPRDSPPREAPVGMAPAVEHPSLMARVVRVIADLRRNPLRTIGVGVVTALVAQLAARAILSTFFPTPTVAQVVADVEPATVLVVANWNGQRESSGTGWVVDAAAGLVVTNHHVIEPGTSWTVSFGGGSAQAAELVATAACDDIAILHIASAVSGAVRLGDQALLRGGDTVVAIGYPGSAAHADNVAATAGVVSVPRTSIPTGGGLDYPNTIQTDAAINPGNSGGPLVNMRGELVGMNTLVGLEVENQAFAIGVDRIRELLPGLRAGNSTNWTGLAMYFPEADELAQSGLPRGPIILGSIPGSPGAGAGLDDSVYQVIGIAGREFDPELDMRDDMCRAVRGAAGFRLALRVTPLSGFDGSGPLEAGEARDVELDLS